MKKKFTAEEIKAFEPAEKLAIVATKDSEGLPHISLLSSMMAMNENKMTIGQFCLGLSKKNFQENKQISFIIITPDKKMCSGSALWTALKHEGAEYEVYNNMPMFRYNAYFGINRVHYFDLLETEGRKSLPLLGIVKSILLTLIAKGGVSTPKGEAILKPFASEVINKADSLSFISYINSNGTSVLAPIFGAASISGKKIVFSPSKPLAKELGQALKTGMQVAIFTVNFAMQSVLIRGEFKGINKHRGISLAEVSIEKVYNSMPPCHGWIYPEKKLEAVTEF